MFYIEPYIPGLFPYISVLLTLTALSLLSICKLPLLNGMDWSGMVLIREDLKVTSGVITISVFVYLDFTLGSFAKDFPLDKRFEFVQFG